MNDKDTIKSAVLLTDNLAQLDNIIQKLDVLAKDLCYNYLEHFDVSAENTNAKHELKLIKTMAEVIWDYSSEASKLSFNLPDVAETILENIRNKKETTLRD